jgi:hypothetical protein
MITNRGGVKESSSVPKRIFFYWDNGINDAPSLVVNCFDSWKNKNPDWELVFLDDKNLGNWLTDESLLSGVEMPIQKRSNLIRLELLNRYGGVWTDATVFCLRPLDDWLPNLGPLGFLCRNLEPRFDRFFSTYFLAAAPESLFLELWLQRYRDFLLTGPKSIQTNTFNSWRRFRKIFLRTSTLRRLATVFWTLRWAARRYGYPYFICHYLANRIILFSPKIRRELGRMPRIKVVDLLQRPFRNASDSPNWLLDYVRSENSAIVKFSHKVESHSRLIGHLRACG